MGLLTFIKGAGEKLFGKGQAQAATPGAGYRRNQPMRAAVATPAPSQ